MDALDFGPATRTVAELVAAVRDDQLRGHTPCPAYVTADLLDHLGGLCLAFTAAAGKTAMPGAGADPSGDGSRLEDGWRDRIGTALGGLADAWDDPRRTTASPRPAPSSCPRRWRRWWR